MEALGDIKQLQHGQLRKGQGIDYMVKPPIVAPTSSKEHEIDTLPGGVSFVDMATAAASSKRGTCASISRGSSRTSATSACGSTRRSTNRCS
jgi:hypothetical protein